jgi:hypothetical protein
MINIIPIVSSIVAILGGIYIALLGFRKIQPENKKPEHRERMELWHKKFGGFAKYGGITLIIIGIFNLVINVADFDTDDKNWTEKQKNKLIEHTIESSTYLKSLDPELSYSIAKCFVDSYTEKYTLAEAWEHDELPPQDMEEIVTPLINKCIGNYTETQTE